MAIRKTKGMPNEYDIRIGARLKEFRHKLGFSQEKLAEAIGITFQQIQKYENGVNRIAAGRLCEIAMVLNIPVNSFFEGVGTIGLADNGQAPLIAVDHETDDGLIELLKTYHAVPSKEKKKEFVLKAKKLAEDFK